MPSFFLHFLLASIQLLYHIYINNDEMPIGWPFGLGFLNMRLRVVESSLPATLVEPYSLSLHIPSTSFSSFSSSNLDTEALILAGIDTTAEI
ncbi:uncharacterized protein [Cicer arietinum]|uniref:Uncharacterized protein LOC101489855 isoform X4 n=1 Tax=Cicer arietinum TaxID=3827 RepID=A0A3Q7YG12_CICAR|nr:uncharacterized protein LOC101489855 isoform X4 [Cicer arietinum]